MHKLWTLAAATAAITGTSVAVQPAASAIPVASATVTSVSPVQLVDGHPYVAGTYSCTGALSHLWVSAKQGGKNLDQEGSGSSARAWWQRTKDNKLKCDGNEHTVLVKLQRTGDSGRLRPEPRGHLAWVQFCVVTGNTPDELNEGTGGFDSNMHFRHVRRI